MDEESLRKVKAIFLKNLEKTDEDIGKIQKKTINSARTSLST